MEDRRELIASLLRRESPPAPAAGIVGRRLLLAAFVLVAAILRPETVSAQPPAQNAFQRIERVVPPNFQDWFGPDRLTNSMTLFLLLTVLTLVPAIIVMTTSFVRIVIVLSIIRQALGTQQLPPNAVLTTLALFMTLHVMHPTWVEIYDNAVVPYTAGKIDADQFATGLLTPIRSFMARQIEITKNHDDVWLFLDYSPDVNPDRVNTYDDVPLKVLLPAFLLSELRTAFLIGFQLFLPFLIIDMAISSILVSMGMLMLPPVLISLPFKLLLFVLVDGWTLLADMLLSSFAGPISLSAGSG
jgi:flagellar biosynthetic protein FliP